jgi:hypothetical protein
LLKEDHKLNIFENKVLKQIFGPKRGGLIGEWRDLLDKELHDLLLTIY